MNTANKLTVLRVLLIPVFLILLYIEFRYNTFIALGVFIIAALTDLADGIVARKCNQVTDFGKFMDPLADKVLVFAAMLWFIEVGIMPAWLVLIVIIREFFVTGIRLVAAAKGRVIAATLSGKIKTGVTIACIIAMFLLLQQWVLFSQEYLLYAVCWALIGITTVVSGVEYYAKNKDVMKMDM